MMLRRFALSCILALASIGAFAADQSFAPVGNSAALSVTSTSTASPIQVGTAATQRMFYNDGPNTAWIAWGATNAVVAVVPTAGSPANGIAIPPGAVMVLSIPPSAFFAAITQSAKTATLYITPGAGN